MAIKRGLGIYLAKIKYSSVNVESSDERDWKGATSSVARLSKQGCLFPPGLYRDLKLNKPIGVRKALQLNCQ